MLDIKHMYTYNKMQLKFYIFYVFYIFKLHFLYFLWVKFFYFYLSLSFIISIFFI